MAYKNPEQQRAYQLGYISAVRKLWFEENGPCAECGSWESLELHHVNREEKVTHLVWSWSAERRKAELAKCKPLCQKCHKAETSEQMTKPLVHGTANGYKGKACRCDECRKWNTEYHRGQRERRALRIAGAGHDPATSAL